MGPVGCLFSCAAVFSCLKEQGKGSHTAAASLLTATVHLLHQHCSGSQMMPTSKLLPELEDETSLIKTVFILRCLTAFFLPQVWFWFVVMVVLVFLFIGVFLT